MKTYKLKLKEWSWNPFKGSKNDFDSGGLNRFQFRKQFLDLLNKSIALRINPKPYISTKELYQDYLETYKKITYDEAKVLAKSIKDNDIFLLKELRNQEWFEFIMHIVVNYGTGYAFNCRSYGADWGDDVFGYGVTPNKKVTKFLNQVEKVYNSDPMTVSNYLDHKYDWIELVLEYVQVMNRDIVVVQHFPDSDGVHYAYVSKPYAQKYINTILNYDVNHNFQLDVFKPERPRLKFFIKHGVKL